MPRRYKKQLLRTCQVMLVSTYFDSADEEATFQLPATESISPANYAVKCVVTKGSFLVKIANDTCTVNQQQYWPYTSHPAAASFSAVSGADNSEYYCVVPTTAGTVQASSYALDAAGVATLYVGTVYFVFGNNFKINGREYSQATVAGIETQDATLEAVEPVSVVECVVTANK